MLTMVGLLLALGLLMDDEIVIAENIATHRAKGTAPLAAAVDVASEVAGGVLSSFVTTVCVIGPLTALEGDIGKVLKVVPIILILVMSVSLVEAFLILPKHMAHSLQHKGTDKFTRFRHWCDAAIAWVRERLLGRTVDALIQWHHLWVGFVTFVFITTVGLFASGIVKFQAFPELDGDVIVARVLMPPGTPLEKNESVVERITHALDGVNAQFASRQPDSQDLVKTAYTRFNFNADVFEAGPHVATVYVDLLNAEVRDARLDDVLQLWRDKVGNVSDAPSIVFAESTLGPAGSAIEIRLQGGDFEKLNAASIHLKDWLAEFRGVYNLARVA